DSAAYRAGLRLSDQIRRFCGVEVRSANHFASTLGTYPAHWPVELVYQRGGQPTRIRFRMDELPMPQPKGGPAGAAHKKPDPFAEGPLTQAANRRAVKRAIDMYRQAIGGIEAA